MSKFLCNVISGSDNAHKGFHWYIKPFIITLWPLGTYGENFFQVFLFISLLWLQAISNYVRHLVVIYLYLAFSQDNWNWNSKSPEKCWLCCSRQVVNHIKICTASAYNIYLTDPKREPNNLSWTSRWAKFDNLHKTPGVRNIYLDRNGRNLLINHRK